MSYKQTNGWVVASLSHNNSNTRDGKHLALWKDFAHRVLQIAAEEKYQDIHLDVAFSDAAGSLKGPQT